MDQTGYPFFGREMNLDMGANATHRLFEAGAARHVKGKK